MRLAHAVRPLAITVLALGTAACVQVSRNGVSASVPLPVTPALETRTPDWSMPTREGQLTNAHLDTLAPRIRALRAEPARLTLATGDTVRLQQQVRILALDSAGTVLGELPRYDFGFSGRGMRLLADGRFHFGRPGTMRFTAELGDRYWRRPAKTRPAATVRIEVEATVP